MTDSSYCKADLLWEATRRNEDYKRLYEEVAGSRNEDKSKWERIWHPGNFRWKIHRLLHPSLSIDDIRAKIDKGADPNEVHPYHYMFEYEHQAIIQHHVPKIDSTDNDNPNRAQDGVKIDSDDYKKYQEFRAIVSNRILLSINPMTRDKDILPAIKKLKKDKRINIKQELDAKKVRGKRSYYPRDINSYIGWLLKYTEIVEHLTQKFGAQGLETDDGIIVLPAKFSLAEVVPDDTPAEKFEGQRKAYETVYQKSIDLIRSSPDIVFQAHRTQK